MKSKKNIDNDLEKSSEKNNNDFKEKSFKEDTISKNKKLNVSNDAKDKKVLNSNKKLEKKLKIKNNRAKKGKFIFLKTLLNRGSYILLGIIFTCLVFGILTGGKNYIKLYYELDDFIEVYDAVTNDYYGDLDKGELISGAIDSMLSNIDDVYTTYVDKDSTDTFLENVNGTYEGIGCMVSMNNDGDIVIIEVFDDSPSSKAGLKVNDIILKVDNEDYTDKTSLDVSEYVKTSDASEIVLNIKREEEIMDITIKREKIDIPVVNSQILEYSGKKIGYISIDVFSSVSYKQIKSKLKKLENDGIESLIVDVRGNNGGYLNSVTDISSLFLKKGKVIYQLEDNDNKEKVKDSTKEYRDYPIAVLVNNGSASASEIFAATIKESYGGYVVGTNTYGKGTVQKTKSLSDGSMVKYTVQKWLTPKGNFINKVGVEPTNIVEFDYTLGYDNQLDEALKLVSTALD